MDTFVESYSFDGITVIPFGTSGSRGIGMSICIDNIRAYKKEHERQ